MFALNHKGELSLFLMDGLNEMINQMKKLFAHLPAFQQILCTNIAI